MEERRVDLVEQHVLARIQAAQFEGLVVDLEGLVREHPLRERLWGALATTLYRSGRQGEALRRLQEAREILANQLGISPGPELTELENKILTHDPSLAPPAGDPGVFRDENVVGREAELARLLQRLGRVGTGEQATVFIGGEPGIGKTTLSRLVADEASRQDACVIVGRCDEHVAAPYRPFMEAITEHCRGLGAAATAELIAPRRSAVDRILPGLESGGIGVETGELSLLERFETYQWLLERLRADSPLVVILEDVHWADSATLRLLHYLSVGSRTASTLLLATHRTTEPAEILGDILADLRGEPQIERLTLSGLGVDDVRRLISDPDAEELAVWVHDQTDGNPFLARELLDHVAATGTRDGVPGGITDVVLRRIRRLSPHCEPLLRHAAVLGDTVPLEFLRGLTLDLPDTAVALRELTERGILVEDTSRATYQFSHAIIRHAALATMTQLDQEDLHLAAAQAWEHAPTSEDTTLHAAMHYVNAGTAAPVERSIDAFERAGSDADRSGAKVEAVQWYDRALKLLSEDDPRHRRVRLTRFVAAQGAWHWHHGDHL